ncbi:MAG TPA: hypothetical protein EYM43_03810 [Alphaproteobacteria bacterium]|nr:hypothetical protein [Alphaproteobacteria bacterium]
MTAQAPDSPAPLVLTELIHDRRAWQAADIQPEDWTVRVSKDAISELQGMVSHMRAHPLPVLLRTLEEFSIPHLLDVMASTKNALDCRFGFCVVHDLPIDDYEIDEIVACFWVLGQLVDRPVAQKWDGTMIYDVIDTGEEFRYGVRGSYTNVELPFHNDNAFGTSVPHYVGLLCRNSAMKGGETRFCSVYNLHNRLFTTSPKLLKRLYRPVFFDRQAEHAKDADTTVRFPMFSWDGQRLSARVNISLVKKGYAVANEPLDHELEDALQAIQEITSDSNLWVEAPIQRGQLQYLNNLDVLHYRNTFEDHEDSNLQRHLYRTWHRNSGSRAYDG